MNMEISDWIVGVMMAVFGLLGLFLAAGAADNEMLIFGLALFAFAVCFVIGLVRRFYDTRDKAIARGGGRPGHKLARQALG